MDAHMAKHMKFDYVEHAKLRLQSEVAKKIAETIDVYEIKKPKVVSEHSYYFEKLQTYEASVVLIHNGQMERIWNLIQKLRAPGNEETIEAIRKEFIST